MIEWKTHHCNKMPEILAIDYCDDEKSKYWGLGTLYHKTPLLLSLEIPDMKFCPYCGKEFLKIDIKNQKKHYSEDCECHFCKSKHNAWEMEEFRSYSGIFYVCKDCYDIISQIKEKEEATDDE